MKIVKLEDFHADGGWDTYSFLKITTDEGLTGWSEFNESRRKGMTALIHGLGAALIGEDPCAIARIDAALYARSRSTSGGLTSHAHRDNRKCLPRHPRQGARSSGLRASRRRGP